MGARFMKSFKWCKISVNWEWVPFLYDSVIETIRSYVRFAGWEVQFIIMTSSKFVEAWYENIDTLESRCEQLTERFLRRSVVLRKSSSLHYLLPDKRDPGIIDRLRHAKTFKPLLIKTEKFRNSFILYCLNHYCD